MIDTVLLPHPQVCLCAAKSRKTIGIMTLPPRNTPPKHRGVSSPQALATAEP